MEKKEKIALKESVHIVYAGGNGLEQAYQILAKIALRKLQEKEKNNCEKLFIPE